MKQPPASSSPLLLFLRLTRPVFLLGGFLMYALGAGIAHYLGAPLNWTAFWVGQGCVTLLQLSAQYLNEYYDATVDRENPNRTFFSGGSGVGGDVGLPQRVALMAAFACLSVGAVLVVLLYSSHLLTPPLAVILFLAFVLSFSYSVPPMRLVSSGYGELTASILVANLVPAFAFLLQTGSFHRLLAMTTFPLTALHLAMLIAFSLPDYAIDNKYGKRTVLIRLGWQRGMVLHNVLIVLAYVLLLLAIFQGMPWRLAWPGFLSLPLGGYQIWRMNQIANGAPPRYSLLTFTAVTLFALTAYFLAFSFWTG
ncbi:MAG: prenyltransferase [Anaerolineaceae bacterium]|nr:prenyltransferase [Anaerolineaceae bacterium]